MANQIVSFSCKESLVIFNRIKLFRLFLLQVETYDVKIEDENLYVKHQHELSLKPYTDM